MSTLHFMAIKNVKTHKNIFLHNNKLFSFNSTNCWRTYTFLQEHKNTVAIPNDNDIYFIIDMFILMIYVHIEVCTYYMQIMYSKLFCIHILRTDSIYIQYFFFLCVW